MSTVVHMVQRGVDISGKHENQKQHRPETGEARVLRHAQPEGQQPLDDPGGPDDLDRPRDPRRQHAGHRRRLHEVPQPGDKKQHREADLAAACGAHPVRARYPCDRSQQPERSCEDHDENQQNHQKPA